ncbi:MAG: ABC transporter ATP-binding protein [Mycobacteriales bacterium]|nr:ABC transporter ATP-binding protein [Frankia sp.]
MPGSPALEAFRLVKDYRGHRAVADLSVSVAAGEVVALLGPNGAGKSTTLKMCAGVADPTYGWVRVADVPVASNPVEARRLLGYVPDVGGLFPRLTGWEHLEFAARLHGLAADWPTRARRLIDLLGLGDAAGRRASTYSHGMARKLSLAIAALPNPRLLLLDEPFDGVDPAGAVAVRQIIAEAVDDGAGVLCSTHLLVAAERISDRMVVIRAGAAIASGDAAALRMRAGEHGALEDVYLALMAETGSPLGAAG